MTCPMCRGTGFATWRTPLPVRLSPCCENEPIVRLPDLDQKRPCTCAIGRRIVETQERYAPHDPLWGDGEDARRRAQAKTSATGYVSSLHDGKPDYLLTYREFPSRYLGKKP